MKNTINQQLKNNYTLKFYKDVQNLTYKRKSLGINQNIMSVKIGVSVKTIQNFENYKCMDYFLIYSYTQILSK
jgi:DNA-binding XRE family transcriptional regulator